ncbi:hypothetical protein BS50DRAFT_589622 [Corynespora cassiicola Philippines]|uniref:Uncharacterized protein n=1 Tax=Corynespora cassiicola Philippines TaxID=1448308 RepID=A0A2T2NIG3_CORCC|nr:hypothetical protein BS50DRAFT_589622 [Corynespora cassiicola Philippines]
MPPKFLTTLATMWGSMWDSSIRFTFGQPPSPASTNSPEESPTLLPTNPATSSSPTTPTATPRQPPPSAPPTSTLASLAAAAIHADADPAPIADMQPLTPAEEHWAREALHPILPQLQHLRQTTRASLPPPHPSITQRPYAQILKARVVPIGRFIMGVQGMGVGDEMRLCRYVADHYWPDATVSRAHVRIFEMYRNADARARARAGQEQGQEQGPDEDTDMCNVGPTTDKENDRGAGMEG